jgi:hypothetical protein
MSVTTTASTTTQGVIRLLADYDLTHTGDDSGDIDSSLNERPEATTRSNPSWWPTDHNGIPPYRPIDRNLDREQRPWAGPGAETVFAWTLLNGVGIVAVSLSWTI